MSRTAVAGKMRNYVANLEFSLNFEDRKNSVKVKINDFVTYDGMTAIYKKENGDTVSGKAPSLQAAINNNWLSLKGTAADKTGPLNVRVDRVRGGENISYKKPEYSPLKGGGFDEFMKDEIQPHDSKVITEEDQIVKKTAASAKQEPKAPPAKREVVGDQVFVKTTARVTSTTAQPPAASKDRKVKIIKSEEFYADRTISRPLFKKEEPATKKKGFTVDKNTPSIPSDATLAEVRRSITKVADESQSARVIKRASIKVVENPEEGSTVVGQTTSAATSEEGITFRKGGTPKNAEPEVKVSAGSDPIADLSGVSTQDQVDQIEAEVVKKAAPVPNYLDQLPDDWSEMHWVKKEAFIKTITDKGFLKFLMRVETVKAVQDACKKRLMEVAK